MIKNKTIKKAFTLVEIMIGILIVSMVIIGGFQALSAITIGKARLIQHTDMQKSSLYFVAKLSEMIKKGGTIDYEEYFNRKLIGNTTYSSGHYDIVSGFGNFGRNGTLDKEIGETGFSYGEGFYYCRSNDGEKMTGDGCVDNFNGGINYNGEQQRYGEYSFQFVDYNSNYDGDSGIIGDEDGDSEIRGDDDDEYLGEGPNVFNKAENLTELYLISGDKKTRTLFRWKVDKDPYGPGDCSLDVNNEITADSCLGTVQYLKLIGKDIGMDHNLSTIDNSQYDGIIDTWIIDTNFTGGDEIVAGSQDMENYWVDLFPNTINVEEFKIFAYPNKDINYEWKNIDSSINISPYVDLKMKLKPSWISRKKLKGEGKSIDFSMTITLSEIYSK